MKFIINEEEKSISFISDKLISVSDFNKTLENLTCIYSDINKWTIGMISDLDKSEEAFDKPIQPPLDPTGETFIK